MTRRELRAELSVPAAWLIGVSKLLVLLAAALAGCAGGAGTSGPADSAVSVVRIIDGDSLILGTATGEVELRLSGINTPERGECHHAEAEEALAILVDRTRLSLAIEGTDQFGRALGRLSADGVDVALELVRGGHGVAVAAASNLADLLAGEDAAHAEGLGMWAPDACGTGPLPLLGFDQRSSSPDPPGRDEEMLGAEVMAIVSRDDSTVDLSGWVLRDGSSRHRYTFPAGTLLGPGDRLEITSADPRWSPGGSPVWSNRGDIALLLDASGRVAARWRY